MTIEAVEEDIQWVQSVIGEWEEVGMGYWLEYHTRYATIDPVIAALGWNIADPKECYPEYPRPRIGATRGGRADYALLGEAEIIAIGRAIVAPAIIIESKPVGADLDDAMPQLQFYVESDPPMLQGMAVLTNGEEWRLYDAGKPGDYAQKYVATVDILKGSRREAAQVLTKWLDRDLWRH